MADYGGLGGGDSLRDALLQDPRFTRQPMSFPPNTGAEPVGAGPVPLPQPRPQMPVQLPAGGVQLPGTFPQAQALQQQLLQQQGLAGLNAAQGQAAGPLIDYSRLLQLLGQQGPPGGMPPGGYQGPPRY